MQIIIDSNYSTSGDLVALNFNLDDLDEIKPMLNDCSSCVTVEMFIRCM